MGTKIVLNEFLAFLDSRQTPQEGLGQMPLTSSYAMCSFGTWLLGILLVVLGSTVPGAARRD